MVVVSAVAVWLYQELGQTNTLLATTRSSLATTETALADTQTTLQETASALGQQTATLNVTKEVLAQTTSDLAAERTVRTQLQQDKNALNASLRTATDENATLTADLAAAVDLQVTLRTDLDDAEAQVSALTTAKADLEGRHQQLILTGGTIGELESKARDLREEIAALEERRRPLILAMQDERVGGFKCTGSMEPVLTCLDSATWMPDFAPEAIVVGATISFPGRACRPDDPADRFIAHRVLDIRVTDGVYYYWPKGDANRIADGCWVPHTAVRGYIIAIHRNTHPENAELRDNVNASEATYDEARTAYYAERDKYCQRDVQHCTVPSGAYGYLVQLRAELVEAQAIYNCWYLNAKDSEYPGHIPHECPRSGPAPAAVP